MADKSAWYTPLQEPASHPEVRQDPTSRHSLSPITPPFERLSPMPVQGVPKTSQDRVWAPCAMKATRMGIPQAVGGGALPALQAAFVPRSAGREADGQAYATWAGMRLLRLLRLLRLFPKSTVSACARVYGGDQVKAAKAAKCLTHMTRPRSWSDRDADEPQDFRTHLYPPNPASLQLVDERVSALGGITPKQRLAMAI